MPSENAGKPLVIVYHADCIDGAACAWCVARTWGVEEDRHANVTYIPYAHHDVAEAEKKIRAAMKPDAEVFFVDVAPVPGFLDELMSPGPDGKAKAAGIHVLDHHASTAQSLLGYRPPPGSTDSAPRLEIKIEEKRSSAARMVWEHLRPGEDVPPVFDVINMMDGNAAGLVTPYDFAAAALVDAHDISTTEKSFQALRSLAQLSFNEMAQKGRHISDDQDVKIDKLLANVNYVPLQILPGRPPVPVPVVNADVKQFGRQISERLVEAGKKSGSGVAFAWFMQRNGTVTMSIRTDGDPDAAHIAAHLRDTMGVTGGGHAGAGAVHFSSLFEFARQMPFAYPAQKPQAAAKPPEKKPGDRPGGHVH